MFGRRFELFKLFGFPVRVDLSWLVIAVLVTWSLAAGLFPAWYPDRSATMYWLMGVVGALGLFASIVVHEFAHALVARRQGMPMRGITLFIFGGVAEMQDQPPSARAEFLVSIAGPLVSMVIASVCFGLSTVAQYAGWPTELTGIFAYLAFINAVLVAFNLLPAFPLDGGRVLRSALWKWKGRLSWATRVSSEVGSGFGTALFILGLVSILGGSFVGGVWWILIGLFLRSAAKTSYQQLQIRQALEGEPVERFMGDSPVTVSPTASVAALVNDYVYRHHHKLYPVTDNGELRGCVSTEEIKAVPRAEWEDKTVDEIALPCTRDNTVQPDTDAVEALAKMRRTGRSRLMVVDDGQLVGMLTLKDLLSFISFKIDLEDETARPLLER
jgi:Zn-dependent protease/CBS domain-containing protein